MFSLSLQFSIKWQITNYPRVIWLLCAPNLIRTIKRMKQQSTNPTWIKTKIIYLLKAFENIAWKFIMENGQPINIFLKNYIQFSIRNFFESFDFWATDSIGNIQVRENRKLCGKSIVLRCFFQVHFFTFLHPMKVEKDSLKR